MSVEHDLGKMILKVKHVETACKSLSVERTARKLKMPENLKWMKCEIILIIIIKWILFLKEFKTLTDPVYTIVVITGTSKVATE